MERLGALSWRLVWERKSSKLPFFGVTNSGFSRSNFRSRSPYICMERGWEPLRHDPPTHINLPCSGDMRKGRAFWGGGITRTELSPSSEHSQLRLCSHPFAWIFTRSLYWIVTGYSYTQIERMSICSSSHRIKESSLANSDLYGPLNLSSQSCQRGTRDRWLPSERLSAFGGASASWNNDRRWERVELCLVYLAPQLSQQSGTHLGSTLQ